MQTNPHYSNSFTKLHHIKNKKAQLIIFIKLIGNAPSLLFIDKIINQGLC